MRHGLRFGLGLIAAMLSRDLGHAGGQLTSVTGIVELRRAATPGWVPVRPIERFAAGDGIRSSFGAAARLSLDDGTLLELGAEAVLAYGEDAAGGAFLSLDFGRLKARVAKASVGRFEVRTPTARLRPRGTALKGSPSGEFEANVFPGGRTEVELHEGLLAVEDNLGNQTFLKPNERLQVDARGLAAPELRPTPAQASAGSLRAEAAAELQLELSQDHARAAVAREARLAELQDGKALVDIGGNRVRVEEYVSRPTAEQFRLVVLNERGDRLDYFVYQGTFNRALPVDLSAALAQLPGCVGRACDWYLTEFNSARSNGADSVVERGVNTLGGQIDVNSNGEGSDDATRLFDSARNAFVDVSGSSVFRTLFNRYGFYINGRLKHGWSGDNITSYADRTVATANDPFTGAALTSATAWLDSQTGALATRSVNVTYPSADRVHQRVYESYSDGSTLQWDNYAGDTEGQAVERSRFGDPSNTETFRRGVLDFHYEQVVTSSHFGGRRIDLVLEPKLLVQAGLLEAGLSGK